MPKSFSPYLNSIIPGQVNEEILKLLKILQVHGPRAILEIGTYSGGTFFLLSRIASSDATLISIDLPEGYPEWKIPLYKSFARFNQKIHLIRNDSHSFDTLRKVESLLNGRNLNFLFIDGDHSYEGVKKDFEMYSPLVRKGIVGFHDILLPGVGKFWSEIKSKFKQTEEIVDARERPVGIGLLYKTGPKTELQ